MTTQLQKSQPTDLAQWTVVDEQTTTQPAATNVYHVHLSGGPAWLATIGQLPMPHLIGIAVIVGSLGGVALVALMALLATLATVGMVAIAGIVFVLIATLALGAMVRS